MAGLVCLCLKAALGYISSRSFHPPSTSCNHYISFKHSFLHCSLFTFSLSRLHDESRGLGCDSLLHKDSPSLFSPRCPPHLHHHSATQFYTHSSFAHLLYFLPLEGLRPWILDSSSVLSLPSTLATIPSSAKHP
jgi:hypothetical protein